MAQRDNATGPNLAANPWQAVVTFDRAYPLTITCATPKAWRGWSKDPALFDAAHGQGTLLWLGQSYPVHATSLARDRQGTILHLATPDRTVELTTDELKTWLVNFDSEGGFSLNP